MLKIHKILTEDNVDNYKNISLFVKYDSKQGKKIILEVPKIPILILSIKFLLNNNPDWP